MRIVSDERGVEYESEQRHIRVLGGNFGLQQRGAEHAANGLGEGLGVLREVHESDLNIALQLRVDLQSHAFI